MKFPTDSSLELHGAGRDLHTSDIGATVIDQAESFVVVDLATRLVWAVEARPSRPELVGALAGIPAGSSFRRALAEHGASEVKGGTLLGQLLDDTPVATLIAGASLARRGLIPEAADGRRRPVFDICAGWATGGVMARAIDEGDTPYLGEGPPAGTLEDPTDPIGWHDFETLPPGSMRRRRRIDLTLETGRASPHPTLVTLDALFRDSYFEPDGTESVVHEYGITGRLDAIGVLIEISVDAHVLPGPECPAAAASAQRLVGHPISAFRSIVGSDFSGTSTCTHLNDMLHSLGCMGQALRQLLPPGADR